MSKYSDPITATGSLISFDAPFGGVFDSLSVPITPTQDLNGYSHPWPAGGGDNLMAPRDSTSNIYNAGHLIPVSRGETIYLYGEWTYTSSSVLFIRIFESADTTSKSGAGTNPSGNYFNSGEPKYVTIPKDGYLGVCYNSGVATYTVSKMMVSRSPITSADDYSPYENVCPISGRTGLSVYVGPTTAQADATTYAFDWTSEAGTVYGGTVDVVTGLLTVTRKTLIADGTQTILSGQSNRFFILVSDAKVVNASNQTTYAGVVCDRFPSKTWASLISGGIGCSPVWGQGVAFKNPDITTAADWNTYFTNNPTQFSYELATPITYQLTETQVEALVGTNNVWVDTSAVITLIYRILQVDRQTDRTSIGKRAESLEVLGKFSSISKVEVNVTENLFYEAGDSSGRTLTVDCPFGTQAMANNLLAMLQGYVYQPFEARRSIANPATELGDGVTVGDVYGGIYAIYHKCGPLHLADLSAPADEEIDHEYKFTPAFERKVERRLNNMQSELSVQAGEISAKVDRQGGDPSSVSWKMDADVFKVAVDGSDVLTVNENGLTVNGDGNFTGNVYAGNIQYGGSAGTMSGNGITSRSIGTGRLTSGINTSLGNADYSADVFSGAVVARFTKANVMMTTAFTFNQRAMKLNTRTVKDGSGNNVTIQYLGAY